MTAARYGRPLLGQALPVLVAGIAALLSCCGGDTIPPPGTPVVSFSATNTKFVSYIVAIDSITLTGADGSFATPLVSAETVDLAQLPNLAELVEAPAVPSDSYTSATLTLDYTNASIWVQEGSTSVKVTPVLPGGSGILTAALTITFDPHQPLVITDGQSSRMAVNFDLDAFNSVDTTSNIVTVNPFVTINQPPLDATQMRARGLFVYTGADFFVMNLRPFFDLVSALGAVTVSTTATTYYNVNGTTYVGDAGLKAMSTMLINTPIAVYGKLTSLSGITPAMAATSVIVGTSLESQGLQDHIRGLVGARTGNTLTIIGGDYLYTTGGVNGVCLSNGSPYLSPGLIYYLAEAKVNLASTTTVSRDGYATGTFDLQTISVGQAIDVGGATTDCTTAGAVTLDASQGQVRLTTTRAWGVVNSATPSLVSLDLLTLGNFDNSAFNLTGTAAGGGEVPRTDYSVDPGSIDVSGTPQNTLLAVDGVVNPFGTAPPAFTASAITLGSATEQELIIEWINGGSAVPFDTIRPDQLVANLSDPNLGTLHAIYTGPEALDLKSLPASPIITTTGAPAADLVLTVGNNTLVTGVSEYLSASGFSAALLQTFDGDNKIFRLVAVGQYNSASNTFVATRINVSLQN